MSETPFTPFEKRPKACNAVHLSSSQVIDEVSRHLSWLVRHVWIETFERMITIITDAKG